MWPGSILYWGLFPAAMQHATFYSHKGLSGWLDSDFLFLLNAHAFSRWAPACR